jgi:hypothetical protein
VMKVAMKWKLFEFHTRPVFSWGVFKR